MAIKLCNNSDEPFQLLVPGGTTQAPFEQSGSPTSWEGLGITWPEPHARLPATWGSIAIGSWWDILIGLLLPHLPIHPIHHCRSKAIRWRQRMPRNATAFSLVTNPHSYCPLPLNNVKKGLHFCSISPHHPHSHNPCMRVEFRDRQGAHTQLVRPLTFSNSHMTSLPFA